ncbi:MAG: 50S ribosomal protein L21 [Holosporaceae bacterium]|jgi:large subunit ribosomal protein L21|nr:50S ribosomal protein L21 [Holosporaceae bacterium]
MFLKIAAKWFINHLVRLEGCGKMFAVVRTGGKQYKVKVGDFISVERLPQEIGANLEITDVLMVSDNGNVKLGNPVISGYSVKASVVEQKKNDTVLVFKKNRRKNFRRKNGHRQPVTILKIENIKH